MKATISNYICGACGATFRRWSGRCPRCEEWNSLREREEGRLDKFPATRLVLLSELQTEISGRRSSGLKELDRLLGGGFVPGSVLLLAGEPGAGKSTLLLEIARTFAGSCVYISGEESLQQIAERARRLAIVNPLLRLGVACSIEEILATDVADLVFVDSIQTVSSREAPAGSQPAMRQSIEQLTRMARQSGSVVITTGHITREGSIAGPRLLEHMVDAVFFFESDRSGQLRILRSIKNRSGRSGESAFFAHHPAGLREVERPDAALSFQNSILSAMVAGSRALPVEIQALVSEGCGRRTAEGLDQKRLMLLAAVMDRYLGTGLGNRDIFVNLAGGLSSDEPGLDLALVAATYASATHRNMHGAFVGEVGLGGEIRPVQQLDLRCESLRATGVEQIFCPRSQADRAGLRGILHVGELPEILTGL
ncbi:MAG: DNA repair protein RadA [Spirochaetales bacterium]|nr:DNA repair protein RadA [Spirochaetales bacterium]